MFDLFDLNQLLLVCLEHLLYYDDDDDDFVMMEIFLNVAHHALFCLDRPVLTLKDVY